MSKNKNSKTALITGGAKRIGKEIAIYLASQGYDLVISYNKSAAEAKKLADEIIKKFQVKCLLVPCDLSKESDVEKLVKFMSKISSWNALVNNASIFSKSKFSSASRSEINSNLNIHFFSPLFLAKAFSDNVKKNKVKDGQIINMVDKNIARFDTNYFYYLLSKKILAELTKMLSLELAPEIRVNAIAPGFILNSVNEKNPSLETQNLIKKIPLKTKGEVENIVQGIDFLLKNKFITGQIIFIDGGASLNHAG